jgi:hypothetical protein
MVDKKMENPFEEWDPADVKAAQAILKNDHKPWMALQMEYKTFLLPYDDGLAIIKAFKNALIISQFYNFDNAKIVENEIKVESKKISGEAVLYKRTLHLLTGGKEENEE